MVNISDTRIVWLEKPEGLQMPDGADRKETIRRNTELMTGDFHEKLRLMTEAGVLEGITVHSKQQFIGTLCVSGPQEKLDTLKQYLEDSGIGSLTENAELRAIQ